MKLKSKQEVKRAQIMGAPQRGRWLVMSTKHTAVNRLHRERSSRESEATSLSRTSTQTLAMPISDLERRLDTHRTLDIFTMTPKVHSAVLSYRI